MNQQLQYIDMFPPIENCDLRIKNVGLRWFLHPETVYTYIYVCVCIDTANPIFNIEYPSHTCMHPKSLMDVSGLVRFFANLHSHWC